MHSLNTRAASWQWLIECVQHRIAGRTHVRRRVPNNHSKDEQIAPEFGLVLLIPKEPPPLAGAVLLPRVEDVPKRPFVGADCLAFTLAVPKRPFPLEAAFFAF